MSDIIERSLPGLEGPAIGKRVLSTYRDVEGTVVAETYAHLKIRKWWGGTQWVPRVAAFEVRR